MHFEFDFPPGSEEELREIAAKHKVTVKLVRNRLLLHSTATCETDSKVRALSFAQEFCGQPDVRQFIRWDTEEWKT